MQLSQQDIGALCQQPCSQQALPLARGRPTLARMETFNQELLISPEPVNGGIVCRRVNPELVGHFLILMYRHTLARLVTAPF